jgi:hypothetical protein
MKDVGKFYSHLVYFTAFLYCSLPFVIFYGHFIIFFKFCYVVQEKSGNPGSYIFLRDSFQTNGSHFFSILGLRPNGLNFVQKKNGSTKFFITGF